MKGEHSGHSIYLSVSNPTASHIVKIRPLVTTDNYIDIPDKIGYEI